MAMLLFCADGRDPYWDLNRKLWRLWHWTHDAMDAPIDVTVVHTGTGGGGGSGSNQSQSKL